MKFFTAVLFLLLSFSQLAGNSPFTLRISLDWQEQPDAIVIGNETYDRWSFKGAAMSEEYPTLPWVIRQINVPSHGELRVEVVNARFEAFERKAAPDDEILSEGLNLVTQVYRERQGYYAKVSFVPIVKRGSRYERLVEAELRVVHTPKPDIRPRGPQNTTTSVLSDGTVYKFAVSETGMHKLTFDWLQNQLGVDNLDAIDPATIKIYGNGGGMLPTFIEAERPDDLIENHIQIIGVEDGSFDAGDFILFHAEGPDRWIFNSANEEFALQKNIYDERNYYFLKISPEPGKRIETQASQQNTAYTSTTFNDFARFEENRVNLLYDWGIRTSKAQGSGQWWFGDWFRVSREYSYEDLFNFPNLDTDTPAKIRARMALRALQRSRFTLEINGASLNSPTAPNVRVLSGFRDNEIDYAHFATISDEISLQNETVNATVRYPHPAGANDGSEGWLDFIQINVRRQLTMTGTEMRFRDTETLDFANATYQLANANSNLLIWDITDPLQPKNQDFSLSGNTLSFGVAADTLREFVAFNPAADFPAPEAVGAIPNQNLHGFDDVDMLIVYHRDFEQAAQRLHDHREDHSGLAVAIAEIEQIYNEFSSGRRDATAIRDFAKMLYERTARFQHLLLLGDGSFDNRDVYENGTNFLPTYQRDSFNPIFTFPSDDYFGIMNGTDPADPLVGDLSIGVGRLPVKSAQEANAVVEKIIHYENAPATYSDWRNRMVFVADDEDGNLHIRDANRIADEISDDNRFMNPDKIYLDAFPQVAASGGDRFPEAKAALNRAIFKGVLAVTYLGHGGERGLAQERVLEISDVVNWNNMDKLPLFITATCSFTGYDNPTFTTAGEETLLNPRGGAIALMTTVRAVFARQNADLTQATLEELFQKNTNGRYRTLGEVMRQAKNKLTNPSTTTNSRKYSLIGDPAMRLAIPELDVQTTQVNMQPVAPTTVDTIRALDRVTVRGIVTGADGQQLTNFNGIVSPTVFDKQTSVSTLGQDSDSPVYDFTVQRNVIFKGRASVTNGAFEFTFVVPRDINYDFGLGKVSYYATDESEMDATGSYERLVIGGTSDGFADEQGPQVDVFMNTEDFVFGGITNSDPTLLVKLEDDNGINVVGNSIGHDLEAVLDGDTQNSFLLNDFYESELDDYRRGSVRFPLFELEEGRHEIRVTAWDVANNPSEGYTEFFVTDAAEVALEHVLNYPNPFTDRTCFQFDHNIAGQDMDVLIQIFTISGRLVKTINQTIFTDGALRLDDCIEWDGRDDYGDRLARGVYLYKVKVRANVSSANSVSGESEFEKLVILK